MSCSNKVSLLLGWLTDTSVPQMKGKTKRWNNMRDRGKTLWQHQRLSDVTGVCMCAYEHMYLICCWYTFVYSFTKFEEFCKIKVTFKWLQILTKRTYWVIIGSVQVLKTSMGISCRLHKFYNLIFLFWKDRLHLENESLQKKHNSKWETAFPSRIPNNSISQSSVQVRNK